MREVSTSIDIQARPGCVWQALTDFASYREWLIDAPQITGKLEVGSSLKLRTGLPDAISKAYKLMVHKVDVESELCWSLNSSAFKIFGSRRRFVIKLIEESKVEFVQVEEFGSLISALSAFVSYRGIRQAMEQMNLALKDRAEQLERQFAVETADLTVWPPPVRK